MTAKLITLEQWAKRVYGDPGPHRKTLQRWAREGKIFPAPQKHGRAYYVLENARYVDDFNSPIFLEALRESSAA